MLSLLVAKTGALQASLYQTEADPAGVERLRVLSLYAYDQPQQIEASFAMGEGLVGQCAAARRTLRIAQVPDSYFRLRSAHLQAAPQHLLFLPILQEQEVLGVLEPACATPLSEDLERFLNSVMRGKGSCCDGSYALTRRNGNNILLATLADLGQRNQILHHPKRKL